MKDSKQYEWTERKVSGITLKIGVGIFLTCLAVMLVSLVWSLISAESDGILWGLAIMFGSMPVSIVFLAIAGITSTKGAYTTKFINTVEERIKASRSKDDLIAVRKYFYAQAVGEDKLCRLGYPDSIKKLHDKIAAQIEILEKIEAK
jgi:hypothetical protein